MKIQAVALLFLFAVILSAPLVAVPADLVPAMAALDKTYIPVLGLPAVKRERPAQYKSSSCGCWAKSRKRAA